MFMNTMAVGPFEPTEFCVTGGATVALFLLQRWAHGDRAGVLCGVHVARFTACDRGARIAIVFAEAVEKPRMVKEGWL